MMWSVNIKGVTRWATKPPNENPFLFFPLYHAPKKIAYTNMALYDVEYNIKVVTRRVTNFPTWQSLRVKA